MNLAEALNKYAPCFKGVREARVHTRNRYHDGTVALTADMVWEDEDFEEPETLSINLSGHGMFPQEGHVFVKDYSEHEGVTRALVESGFVTIVDKVPIGFGSGYHVKLNPTLLTGISH